MQFEATSFEGLFVLNAEYSCDPRGSFARLYCQDELSVLYPEIEIKQINHSINRESGTLRGLHFQYPPFAEIKIVRCIKGAVYDVAVDIRRNSPTFLKYFATELSQMNGKAICIPQGFAHGFQILEPDSELLYLHSNIYETGSEGGVNYRDPKLAIEWPLPELNVSERDLNHAFLDDSFGGV